MKKQIIYTLMAALLSCAPISSAQQTKRFSQSFSEAPLEMLVDFYNEWAHRTLIIQANLDAPINLKFSDLTKEEAMQAIETVLAMNGVALVPMGEKFLKVVPIETARQEGMTIEAYDPEKKYSAADQLLSQIIPLRYVVFSDVQPVVQHLVHAYGKIQSLERINSLLVTDTSANIARISEVLQMLDQPLEKIEPRIYQLNHATAEEIASKLKELVEAARPATTTQQEVVANARTIPGVIRAPRTTTVAAPVSDSGADETQMIQGEVKFVSDERTNILIVFSKQANFDFFDRIIKVLDVPVDPEVVVETINLEYAEAEEISSILNEFVGAVQSDTSNAASNARRETGASRSLNELIARRTGRNLNAVNTETKGAMGRLSEETKILSDERTNSLLLMGSKSDVEALKTVIASLDVMLQQVMIEAVILNIGLDDSIQTGVQWVYDSLPETQDVLLNKKVRTYPYTNSLGIAMQGTYTEYEYGQQGDLSRVGFDAANLASNMIGNALSYYGRFPQLNVKTIVSAAKRDSDARVLSTPVVLTTDNTEATITVADERPVITSSINSGNGNNNNQFSARATYEYKTIGIDLTVTPHINPQNFVLMEITQSADDVGGNISVDGNEVPIIQKREISATVGVKDRETIVLGGLVRKSKAESSIKIPLLGDIPLLGWLFRSHSQSDDRQELVVLLTPYVLNNPQEAHAETLRRFQSTDSQTTEWPRGWSLSELANDEPEKDAWKQKKEVPSTEMDSSVNRILDALK